jgi:alpha-aminoadipic semialdehyde synthase
MYRYKTDDAAKRNRLSKDEIAEEYKRSPELFESNMDTVFPYVTLLMNCILWSPKYPRLISRDEAKTWFAQHKTLKGIGDITCDPEGAIQFSQETWVDSPVFIHNPATNTDTIGFDGDGIAVMAVTNLPCEFSADASTGFCANLTPFLPALAAADFDAIEPQFAGLPPEIARAVILWRGKLTEPYQYMAQYVEGDSLPVAH